MKKINNNEDSYSFNNLDEYKKYYVLDGGHWYVSKVKQYKPSSIQQFAKILGIIDSVINAYPESEIFKNYMKFHPKISKAPNNNGHRILVDKYSKMFISLKLYTEGFIDKSHLEAVNPTKFKTNTKLLKHFMEKKDYNFLVSTYNYENLYTEFVVHYRNIKSWLGKFGFYGENANKTPFITEAGKNFINHKNDQEALNAIFLNQVKRYQIYAPTINKKYSDYKIRPYYLLLEVLLKLDDHYISKNEHALFVTKIKSHSETDINQMIYLIKLYRSLHPEKRKQYIKDIKDHDKKNFRKRIRPLFVSLIDSAPKELDCFSYGNLIIKGEAEYKNKYIISDKEKAKNEITEFKKKAKIIDFKEELDWIAHIGSLEGLTVESIIQIYINSGSSLDTIKEEFSEDLTKRIEDKIYEKEIEDYYVQNIHEINSNLEIVTDPNYGRQFSTHIGPIDILCIDKKTKEYVVCELKRGQSSDETVGQLLRYMGWVYTYLSKANNKVSGIIVSSQPDIKVEYSLTGVQSDHIFNLINTFNHPFTNEKRPPIQSL
jgi:RecB family endonuclease NucS